VCCTSFRVFVSSLLLSAATVVQIAGGVKSMSMSRPMRPMYDCVIQPPF